MAAAPELLKALQDIIAEFWAEYEYPDRPPEQSPTVEATRKADYVIRKAKGEMRTNVLNEFNRLCQTRDLAAHRALAAIQTVVLLWAAQTRCGASTLRNSLEVMILVFFQNFGKWRWLPVTR
jgi:hypothetical protein